MSIDTTSKKPIRGFLGIDNGTQGLSIIFTDEQLNTLATGEGSYNFVENLPEGCYEQRTNDWDEALVTAMSELRQKLPNIQVLAIGISGQMHGEVLIDKEGKALQPVRLWCDARNEAEGHELTQAFGIKVPKRATAARFLYTARQKPSLAEQVRHITTPAGWCAYRLTGEFSLGIGDAAGMFPIDNVAMNYRESLLDKFDDIVNNTSLPRLRDILPTVRRAGQDAGTLHASGSRLLGLPVGIPVAPAEGDQVAALAGSLIGRAGSVSCSFGTSVCANIVGDREFCGVSPAVDHFCAADGKPINMVWLRNGTTFMNAMVESYGTFVEIMPQMIAAPADCGGLLALPFMNDEPGLQVSKGGSACIIGWTPENARAGNVAKAALLSTMFNLWLNCRVLDEQGYAMNDLVLTGGLAKTPESGQILSDVFNLPVRVLPSAQEGSSWGAAVLAAYRYANASGQSSADWCDFLETIRQENVIMFRPNPENVIVYRHKLERYQRLLASVPHLTELMNETSV